MLDTAFEALKKFDWGSDLAALNPIEDAAIAAHEEPEAGKELESRLVAALQSELSLDAQEYVCRKLAMVGTAAAVPSLAALLVKKENSHMARFALERIPASEAAQALRDALPKVSGRVKIGVISSLGARRDTAAVPTLAGLLKDGDPAIARAAALALGTIGSAESAAALQLAQKAATGNPLTLIDALLSCAEAMLANNKLADASAIYKTFDQASQPRLVRLATARGLLACASKQA
jgi:HEAT repeat protein